MTMLSLIKQAQESAKRQMDDTTNTYKAEGYSETLADGSVVTCIGVLSSNAFETVVGHIKTTWKLNGKRSNVKDIEALYMAGATDAEVKEMNDYKEQKKWLAKFGIKI